MTFNSGLDEKKIQNTVKHLESLLADTFILYTKTLNFHWNVVGVGFAGLHAFFEEQYTTLALSVDELAERIRVLGFRAPGTLREFIKLTHLHEVNDKLTDAQMIQHLLDDHESIAAHIRKDLQKIDDQDLGTKALLEDLLSGHEKTAWMLRSHLG